MALFEDLFNNENFGRVFQGSSRFRSMLQRRIEEVGTDTWENFGKQKLKVEIDPKTGKVAFRSDDLNYTYRQLPNEAMPDFFNRVMFGQGATDPDLFNPTTGFELGEVRSSEVITSRQITGRRRLGVTAQRENVDIRIRRFAAGETVAQKVTESLRDPLDPTKTLGMVAPDTDGSRVIEMWDRSTKRKLTHGEIAKVLNIDPYDASFGKRIKALLNGPMMALDYEPGELKIARLNTQAILGNDPIAMERVRARVEREARLTTNPNFDPDARMAEIIRAETDGINFQSRAANDSMLAKLEDMYKETRKDILRTHGAADSLEKTAELRQLADFRKQIQTIREAIKNGDAFNLRALAGRSILDGEDFGEFVKGDIMVIENDLARQMLRASDPRYAAMTDLELDQINLIAPESIPDLGIRPGSRGLLTVDIVERAGAMPHSNMLSVANLGDAYNPVMPSGKTLLEESLENALGDASQRLRRGDIGPLRAIAAELRDLDLERDFNGDRIAFERAQETQRFVKRVEQFVAAGNPLEFSPEMMEESLRTVREHYFQRRTAGGTISFGGREVPDLRVRIPMPNAAEGHGVSRQIITQRPSNFVVERPTMMLTPPGLNVSDPATMKLFAKHGITPGVTTTRFQFGDFDIDKVYAAMGGPDWDDRFVTGYYYDPTAKRMLAHASRDPNRLAEYAYFDTDLAMDPKYGKKTVVFRPGTADAEARTLLDLSLERKKVLIQLEQIGRNRKWNPNIGKKSEKQINKWIVRLNDINDALHRAYSGDAEFVQQELAPNYIPGDPARRYAPEGSAVTPEAHARYTGGSVVRGYGQYNVNAREFMERFGGELTATRQGEDYLPWEFRGRDFSELFEDGKSRLWANAADMDEFSAILNPEATGRKRAKKLTARANMSRYEAVSKAEGLLGRTVNVTTGIEHFIDATRRSGELTDDQFEAFQNLVNQEGRIIRMERERLIDTLRKTGEAEIIDVVNTINDRNLYATGRILGGMEGIGIDPALLGQRFKGDSGPIRQIMSGYQSVVPGTNRMTVDEFRERISLSPDDPRATAGRLFENILGQEESFREASRNMVDEVSYDLAENIKRYGPEFTERELSMGEEFLQEFMKNQQELLNVGPDEVDRLLAAALDPAGGVDADDILAEYSPDEVHRRSLQQLKEMGVLDDVEARDRVLLAARLKAAEADVVTGKLTLGRALDQTLSVPGASIGRMYNQALARGVVDPMRLEPLRDIAQAYDPRLADIATYMREAIRPTLRATRFSTPQAKARATAEILDMLRQQGGQGFGKEVQWLAPRMGMSVADDVTDDQLLDHILQAPIETEPIGDINLEPPPGSKRLGQREIADTISGDVPRRMNTLKRFNREELGRLASVPGFRKGLGAAAIFGGLALLHEMRGERTPEDMQGPPLLPGGNPYDEYESSFSPQSIYSAISQGNAFSPVSTGYTYQVRASGEFNPQDFQSQLGGITGSNINSTVYSARRTTAPQTSTSVQILNALLEPTL